MTRALGRDDLALLGDLCSERVADRHDEVRACSYPTFAARLDEDGDAYPVCAHHTRPPLVPLARLLGAAAPAPNVLPLETVFENWTDGAGRGWDAELAWVADHDGDYLDRLGEDIADHGMARPILLGSDGRVWDGHHRLAAAARHGLTEVPVEVVPARVAHDVADHVRAALADSEGRDGEATRAAVHAALERAEARRG